MQGRDPSVHALSRAGTGVTFYKSPKKEESNFRVSGHSTLRGRGSGWYTRSKVPSVWMLHACVVAHVCKCVYACMCVPMCVYACMCTFVHLCKYIHDCTCVCECMHACMCEAKVDTQGQKFLVCGWCVLCVQMCVHMCVCACVCACMGTSVCLCMCVCTSVCLYMCVHTCVILIGFRKQFSPSTVGSRDQSQADSLRCGEPLSS